MTAASDTANDRPDVCVLGLGLIGGSVLRAARVAGRECFGFDVSASALEAAAAEGFSVEDNLDAVLRRADVAGALLVVAVPLPQVEELLTRVVAMNRASLITDTVSVKTTVLQLVRKLKLDNRYAGGHPMAGLETAGWESSSAALFDGAPWMVGTEDDTHRMPWRQAVALALDCGAQVVPIDARAHDDAVARVSHLPHVLAEVLAATGADGGPLALGLAAGSFRDGTRVAAAPPALVRAMTDGNRPAVMAAVEDALERLQQAHRALAAAHPLDALITAGRKARAALDELEPGEITGIVPGDPGWREAMRSKAHEGLRLRAL